MKSYIFVMKYIDHDSGSKCIIEITIRCFHEMTWDAGDGHAENDALLLNHIKWEGALKKKVCDTVNNEHKDYNLGAYQLLSVSKDRKGCLINVNHGTANKNVTFKKEKWIECCTCKHTKGVWPQNKHIGFVLGYKKQYHFYDWTLTSEPGSLNITFDTKCKHDRRSDPLDRRSDPLDKLSDPLDKRNDLQNASLKKQSESSSSDKMKKIGVTMKTSNAASKTDTEEKRKLAKATLDQQRTQERTQGGPQTLNNQTSKTSTNTVYMDVPNPKVPIPQAQAQLQIPTAGQPGYIPPLPPQFGASRQFGDISLDTIGAPSLKNLYTNKLF